MHVNKEIVAILEKKQSEVLNRLKALNADKTRKSGPIDPDFEEQAATIENDEIVDGIDHIDRLELKKINGALTRVKNGTYGICLSCGENISEKRLKALPYASLCMSCRETE